VPSRARRRIFGQELLQLSLAAPDRPTAALAGAPTAAAAGAAAATAAAAAAIEAGLAPGRLAAPIVTRSERAPWPADGPPWAAPPLLRLAHPDVPTVELVPVELLDGIRHGGGFLELDERKTTRAAGLSLGRKEHLDDVTRLGEQRLDRLASGLEVEVADEDLGNDRSLLGFWRPRRGCR